MHHLFVPFQKFGKLLQCLGFALTLTPWAASSQTTEIHHFQFAGEDRSYYLQIPAGADSTHLVPLVVDLHGYSNPANGQRGFSTFRTKGQLDTFAVAWPQGIGNSWNVGGGCCGDAGKSDADDVGFMKAVVNRIRLMSPINGHRVYVTGHSNGGAMVKRLAIEASDVFAAAVDYSGFLLLPVELEKAIPIRQFHGLQDIDVPFQGDSLMPSAESTLVLWKDAEHCDGEPDTLILDSATGGFCQTYTKCDEGSQVSLCRIAGDHMIYNNPAHLDIAEMGWAFMRQFSLASPPDLVGLKSTQKQFKQNSWRASSLKKKLRPIPHQYLGRGWERL